MSSFVKARELLVHAFPMIICFLFHHFVHYFLIFNYYLRTNVVNRLWFATRRYSFNQPTITMWSPRGPGLRPSSFSTAPSMVSSTPSFSPPLLRTLITSSRISSSNLLHSLLTSPSSCSLTTKTRFKWDDALRISESTDALEEGSPNLQGFFQRIKTCNRGSEMISEFLPFVVEEQIAGYVHKEFVDHLRQFHDVFEIPKDTLFENRAGGYVTLHRSLTSAEDRTDAVASVIKSLGERFIPGIRNELYPVTSEYGRPLYFSLERAAAPYFGIKAYGVHMNGYINKSGQKHLWIAKRSETKPTFPGMLDHLVAGGLPYNINCKDNIVKECEEEAGIPMSISKNAVPVGAVSYMDIDGLRYKRDVLFCYDLELPDDFIPINQDGEVESFKLVPVNHVADIIRTTEFFKPNCNLVIIDFLFRHGFIGPDQRGYLQLLQSLRSGDCS